MSYPISPSNLSPSLSLPPVRNIEDIVNVRPSSQSRSHNHGHSHPSLPSMPSMPSLPPNALPDLDSIRKIYSSSFAPYLDRLIETGESHWFARRGFDLLANDATLLAQFLLYLTLVSQSSYNSSTPRSGTNGGSSSHAPEHNVALASQEARVTWGLLGMCVAASEAQDNGGVGGGGMGGDIGEDDGNGNGSGEYDEELEKWARRVKSIEAFLTGEPLMISGTGSMMADFINQDDPPTMTAATITNHALDSAGVWDQGAAFMSSIGEGVDDDIGIGHDLNLTLDRDVGSDAGTGASRNTGGPARTSSQIGAGTEMNMNARSTTKTPTVPRKTSPTPLRRQLQRRADEFWTLVERAAEHPYPDSSREELGQLRPFLDGRENRDIVFSLMVLCCTQPRERVLAHHHLESEANGRATNLVYANLAGMAVRALG